MPTYEYLCSACNHRFEEFQSMTAKALEKCPECRKKTLQRLIGAGAGVIFKGSGFYQTDYRSSSYSRDAGSDGKDAGGKSGGSAGGCTPTCGTDQAPAGCKMNKKSGGKD